MDGVSSRRASALSRPALLKISRPASVSATARTVRVVTAVRHNDRIAAQHLKPPRPAGHFQTAPHGCRCDLRKQIAQHLRRLRGERGIFGLIWPRHRNVKSRPGRLRRQLKPLAVRQRRCCFSQRPDRRNQLRLLSPFSVESCISPGWVYTRNSTPGFQRVAMLLISNNCEFHSAPTLGQLSSSAA